LPVIASLRTYRPDQDRLAVSELATVACLVDEYTAVVLDGRGRTLAGPHHRPGSLSHYFADDGWYQLDIDQQSKWAPRHHTAQGGT
jgi:hypothetical protein